MGRLHISGPKKAFDEVPHKRLSWKLKGTGGLKANKKWKTIWNEEK